VKYSHYPLTDLDDRCSKARWSVNANGRAIVFVHGFNGTCVETWCSFDNMLPLDQRFDGVDLIFFGWDTFRYDISASSERLAYLLRTLETDRHALMRVSDLETPDESKDCKAILICAHSMGAVISRHALLRSIESGRPWTAKIGLVLFAPAHLGVAMNIAVWVASKLSLPLRQLIDGVVLHQLRYETESYAKGGGLSTLITPLAIVQAQTEKWIRQGGYNRDPRSWIVEGANHSSICKPTANFTLPIEVVCSALAELRTG
jgi:pimeloyl-ACP methyl ester carboxylesterase